MKSAKKYCNFFDRFCHVGRFNMETATGWTHRGRSEDSIAVRQFTLEDCTSMATIYPIAGREARLPNVECDDDTLLNRVRDNDADAYRILVERHIDHAYSLALRMLKRPADAEDVTQDAFVKVWINRHRWQSKGAKFTTWLYRVIVNRCIDFQRMPHSEPIEDVPEPIDEAEDVLTSIHKGQVYNKLDTALSRLPKRQRAVLALSYYEEMNNGEVAAVLGLSVSAVESLLKRGRQTLRGLLRRAEKDVRTALEQG